MKLIVECRLGFTGCVMC